MGTVPIILTPFVRTPPLPSEVHYRHRQPRSREPGTASLFEELEATGVDLIASLADIRDSLIARPYHFHLLS